MLSPTGATVNILKELTERLEVYSTVLKSAQEEGNSSKERRYKRIIKQYEDAIKSHKSGRVVAFDELPNPPGFEPIGGSSGSRSPSIAPSSPVMTRATGPTTPQPSPMVDRKDPPVPDTLSSETPTTFEMQLKSIPTIVVENDVLEDPMKLQQELKNRLEVYQSIQNASEEEGNTSKARRYKRIVAQYNNAIVLLKSGKPVPLEELPNPPGFNLLVAPKSAPPSPLPSRSSAITSSDEQETSGNQTSTIRKSLTRAEKQTLLLKQRQQEYKEAALNAKKLGQLGEAKEFLRMYKGFDKLITASEGGLQVDLTSIPISLKVKENVEESFHIVTDADFQEGSTSDVYDKLETELLEQIKRCMDYKTNFRNDGDIANANRFELYATNFKKDLTFIKAAHRRGDPIPKFHYEMMTFPVIKSCHDLTDNELELDIVQGINYTVSNPKDVDTYVKYEFPYPSETVPKGQTKLVKDTNNPVYNEKIKFPIQRDSKSFQRLFKRQSTSIKLEVMVKGGFFKSDTLFGTVAVKLLPLATEPIIHEAFDIMNGRKAVGGKIEIKIRVRHPFFTRKVEKITEKWVKLN